MLNFYFLQKGLEIVSPAHLYMLHSITWKNFIDWLSALCVLQLLVTRLWPKFIIFEINLIFRIKPFFLHAPKVETKIWISWERKELYGEVKSIYKKHFWRVLSRQKLSQTWQHAFKEESILDTYCYFFSSDIWYLKNKKQNDEYIKVDRFTYYKLFLASLGKLEKRVLNHLIVGKLTFEPS